MDWHGGTGTASQQMNFPVATHSGSSGMLGCYTWPSSLSWQCLWYLCGLVNDIMNMVKEGDARVHELLAFLLCFVVCWVHKTTWCQIQHIWEPLSERNLNLGMEGLWQSGDPSEKMWLQRVQWCWDCLWQGKNPPLWVPSSTPRREPWHPLPAAGRGHLRPFFWVPPRIEPIQFTQHLEELKCCAISAGVGLLRQDHGCVVLSPSRRVDKSLWSIK